MSSVLHPVGPERRGTYWRRRLVLVAVLVVLVVLVVLGVRALTADAGAGGATTSTTLDPNSVSPAPVTSGSPTDSPTTSPTDGATGTPTDGATESPTASDAAVGPVQACDPAALEVTLSTRASVFGPGATPEFILTVKNPSEVTCTAEVGSGARLFTVADESGAQVFSTSDCQASTSTANYDLEPGGSRSMTAKWSRQRTAIGCPTGQESVGPGTYTLAGSWLDVPAAPVSFGISA